MQLGRCFLVLSLLVVACDGLKEAGPSGAAEDGGSPGSSGGPGSSSKPGSRDEPGSSSGDPQQEDAGTTHTEDPPKPRFGPGKYGALPSGYCCNDDSECRYRHCEAVGGSGKMCLDSCRRDPSCQRPPDFTAFTCDNGGDPFVDGFCKPTAAFTCIPAAKFELGTSESGGCCTATGDGWAGLECLGGVCVARGSGPWVCSNACKYSPDCPKGKGLFCPTDDRVKRCIPDQDTYTCN